MRKVSLARSTPSGRLRTVHRQRLLELLTAVTSSNEAERRLAVHDLDLLSDAENEWQQQATVNDHDPEYRAWQEAYLTGVGAAHHTAA
jgi:hypothetical protein